MASQARNTPWFLWPFQAIGRFIGWIVALVGRAMAVILGFIFLVLGAILTVTVIGAILGVPLVILGLLMILRGLF